MSHCKNCKERVSDGTFPHSDAHFEGYVIPVHIHHLLLSDTPKVSITSILTNFVQTSGKRRELLKFVNVLFVTLAFPRLLIQYVYNIYIYICNIIYCNII